MEAAAKAKRAAEKAKIKAREEREKAKEEREKAKMERQKTLPTEQKKASVAGVAQEERSPVKAAQSAAEKAARSEPAGEEQKPKRVKRAGEAMYADGWERPFAVVNPLRFLTE
jgi:signal transduction histidine kinase